MNGWRSFLRAAGSLWLGGVLLLLLILAMACATVYEAVHGTPQALAVFYTSWWFQALLGLVAVSSLAAALARWPWSVRQCGLVITHLSIVVILLGAYVTNRWSIDGQLGLAEEQTAASILLRTEQVILHDTVSHRQAEIELDPHAMLRRLPEGRFDGPTLQLGELQLRMAGYLPNATQEQRIVNDAPHPQPAVQIALSMADHTQSHWIFANQPAGHGQLNVTYHWLDDAQALAQRLDKAVTTQPASAGMVHFTYANETHSFPIESCIDESVALGTTGLTAQIVRLLTHAVVDGLEQIRDDPTRPANPAIEVKITGPEGTRRQMAFARFPDFDAMMAGMVDDWPISPVKIIYETSETPANKPLIELFGAPEEPLHVRFNPHDEPPVTQSIEVGQPIESPWPGIGVEVAQQFDRARIDQAVVPAEPHDESAASAVQLEIAAPGSTDPIWLMKNVRRSLRIGDTRYELIYRDKAVPLGFQVTLDRFHIGHYPGTQRPRSYESTVTFHDPDTGRQHRRVVSMNHPAHHGGYTFFQSSYREDPDSDRWISFLSVAWDPGKPITFAGYVGLVAGMIWIAITRVVLRRADTAAHTGNTALPQEKQG